MSLSLPQITGLKAGTAYHLRVSARNVVGVGKPTKGLGPVVAETRPGKQQLACFMPVLIIYLFDIELRIWLIAICFDVFGFASLLHRHQRDHYGCGWWRRYLYDLWVLCNGRGFRVHMVQELQGAHRHLSPHHWDVWGQVSFCFYVFPFF